MKRNVLNIPYFLKKMLIGYKLSFPIFSANFCTKQISTIVHSCTYIKESLLIAALLQGSHMQVFKLSVLQQKKKKYNSEKGSNRLLSYTQNIQSQ